MNGLIKKEKLHHKGRILALNPHINEHGTPKDKGTKIPIFPNQKNIQ